MPRFAEKLLVMLCAAAGQGAISCPMLCRANAEGGDANSCSCAHHSSCDVHALLCSAVQTPSLAVLGGRRSPHIRCKGRQHRQAYALHDVAMSG